MDASQKNERRCLRGLYKRMQKVTASTSYTDKTLALNALCSYILSIDGEAALCAMSPSVRDNLYSVMADINTEAGLIHDQLHQTLFRLSSFTLTFITYVASQ